MDIRNGSQVTAFVLSGLTNDEKLIPFLFVFFLLAYLATLVGNIGLIIIVLSASKLHTPMYYFLSCLAVVDFFYSSNVTPKLITDLISFKKIISFNGCVLQLFFTITMSATEVPLLSSMSYDRYAAVCHPLHYISIMTKKKCLFLVCLSIFAGFLASSVLTICVFSLPYCGPNFIDHFYCDVPFVLQLSCSETLHCSFLAIFLIASSTLLFLSIIVASYVLILSTILHIKSSQGRQKAFSTCSSHLMCVFIFYTATLFTFMRSPSKPMEKQDKVASVVYLVVTPMLNPFIYSLRNQEVKRAIMQIFFKSTHLEKDS
ncbi:olfactory receptor 5B21-like [Hyperolius riggenbachi]|uniref:olfactory receptor 5B21-like n=1 Tax=Hyperolius riggenbachi TaxID=752182 RepID=UPI0035A38BAB